MNLLDKAINNLGLKRKYSYNGVNYVISFLVRDSDQRPLSAPWWKDKSATIIGADINGNFFIHHCNGKVLYWNHAEKNSVAIANSLKDFLNGLEFDNGALP